jgi:hypothetical protein
MMNEVMVVSKARRVRELVRRAMVLAFPPGRSAQSGQGTVEYVGLILLVSLLMVGMVAAMKGFSGAQGTELAELIVDKIQSAVDKISFR